MARSGRRGIEEPTAVNESELITAIRSRRCVRFRYRNGERIVEPYAFGINAGGTPVLRGYQIGGESTSRAKGWKLFRVDEIADLTLLDQRFAGSRQGYMRNDPAMAMICAEL